MIASQVTNSTFTQFDNVADHGLSTVEWIYRTRVEREPVEGFRPFEDALSELGLRDTDKDVGWEDTVESWIREYRAAIHAHDRAREDEGAEEYSNFGYSDWDPDFVCLIRRTLSEGERTEGNTARARSVEENLCYPLQEYFREDLRTPPGGWRR